jgi:hypothetical protein
MDCDDPQSILDILIIYQPCIVSKRINQKGSLPFDDGTAHLQALRFREALIAIWSCGGLGHVEYVDVYRYIKIYRYIDI